MREGFTLQMQSRRCLSALPMPLIVVALPLTRLAEEARSLSLLRRWLEMESCSPSRVVSFLCRLYAHTTLRGVRLSISMSEFSFRVQFE